MGKAIRNWWTTIAGFIAALGTYAAGVGAKPPETADDWFKSLVSLAFLILGALAKDGTTGSPPGAKS